MPSQRRINMTTKFKILSSISFIALAVVLTFVGVWALTDLDFAVGGNITYTAPEVEYDPVLIKMGSYNGKDVEWRLIGVDGNAFKGKDLPSAGIGTFVLQTDLGIYKYFDENGYYDYYNSDIRNYLNNSFVSALSLTNNSMYKNITSRTMKDLYTDIAWDYNTTNEITSVSTSVNKTDKLWLLSVKEVYELLGREKVQNNILEPHNYWEEGIISKIEWNDLYWLRSPCLIIGEPFIVGYGDYDYGCYTLPQDMYECLVRPAFNIDLSLL